MTKIQGEKGTWNTTHVAIRDTTLLSEEGENGRVVFEYDRNYGMMGTFEPFRQLKDGVWRDYALISTKYTRFEVVDLVKGEIVAVEAYPVVTQEMYDRIANSNPKSEWLKTHPVGTELPGSGFCPTGFRVFDWRGEFDDDSVTRTFDNEDAIRYLYSEEDLYSATGQWAVYTGCVWGDDSSWKLRYIDLSRISEGIVTSEDRFGYFPLSGKLSDISFSDGDLYMSVEVMTSLKTGKSFDPGLKWAKDDHDYYKEDSADNG